MNFIKHIVDEDLRKEENTGFYMNGHLITNSGIILSVQASSFHYCTPRENLKDLNDYKTFELGFIDKEIGLIDNVKGLESLQDFERIEELMGYKVGTVFSNVSKDLIEDLYIHLNL